MSALRILFVKRSLEWPRQSGHDVHLFNMMRALGELGHSVGLATFRPIAPEALQGFQPEWHGVIGPSAGSHDLSYSGLQDRFRSYWGAEPALIAALRDRAREFRADAVVAAGMDVLPYFPALRGECTRVWYAADDLARQYLMWVRPSDRRTWPHLKQVAIMAAYERAFARDVDRAWAVSPVEARALRRFGGFRTIDVLPNGVDADHFAPVASEELPESAVFWGRLDFAPNVQAVLWFTQHVWPAVRRVRPNATVTLMGFNPEPGVRALHGTHGIEIIADAPDIRPEVCRRAVVVLPFLSGGGIKNKLLEAAALARPIVCSRHAVEGLDMTTEPPIRVAHTPEAWRDQLMALWDDGPGRRQIGARTRAWVTTHHAWRGVAQRAAQALSQSRP